MAEIQFHVETDWQDVQRLVREIDALQSSLSSVNTNLPSAEIEKLNNKLTDLKQKYSEVIAFASRANADLSDVFSKSGGIGGTGGDLSKNVSAELQRVQATFNETFNAILAKVDDFKKSVSEAFSTIGNIKANFPSSAIIGEIAEKTEQISASAERQRVLITEQATQNDRILQQKMQETSSVIAQGNEVQELTENVRERANIEGEVEEKVNDTTNAIKGQTDVIKENTEAIKENKESMSVEAPKVDLSYTEELQRTIDEKKKEIEELKQKALDVDSGSVLSKGIDEAITAKYKELDQLTAKLENINGITSVEDLQKDFDSLSASIEETKSKMENLSPDTVEYETLNSMLQSEEEQLGHIRNKMEALRDEEQNLKSTTDSLADSGRAVWHEFSSTDKQGNAFTIIASSAEEADNKVKETEQALKNYPKVYDEILGKIEQFQNQFGYGDAKIGGFIKEVEKLKNSLQGVEGAEAFKNGEAWALNAYDKLDGINIQLDGMLKREGEAEEAAQKMAEAEERAKEQAEQHAQSAMRLRTQIMNAREEMSRMIAEGKKGTPEFAALAEKAGDMRDNMQKANAVLNYYADNQRGLHALKTGLQGVAGAASLVTGVMGLFNEDSKKMLQIQTQIQSVLGVVVGLEMTYNLVKKESFFRLAAEEVMTWALAKARGAETVATVAATAAQEKLNVTMMKNPYGAIAVLLITLAAAIYGVVKALTSETEAEKKAKEARKKAAEERKKMYEDWANSAADSAAKQLMSYKKLQDGWNKLGNNMKAKEKFVKDNKKAFNDLGFAVDSVSKAENFLVNNTNAVVNAIMARAKAAAYAKVLEDEYEKEVRKRLDEDKKGESVEAGGSVYTMQVGATLKGAYKRKAYTNAVKGGWKAQAGDIVDGKFTEQGIKNLNYYGKLYAAKLKEAYDKRVEARRNGAKKELAVIEKNIEKEAKAEEIFSKKVGVPTYKGKEPKNNNDDKVEKRYAKSIADEIKFQDELEKLRRDAERARIDAEIARIEDDGERERRARKEQHRRTLEDLELQKDEIYKKIYQQRKAEYEAKNKGQYELTDEGKKGWRGIKEQALPDALVFQEIDDAERKLKTIGLSKEQIDSLKDGRVSIELLDRAIRLIGDTTDESIQKAKELLTAPKEYSIEFDADTDEAKQEVNALLDEMGLVGEEYDTKVKVNVDDKQLSVLQEKLSEGVSYKVTPIVSEKDETRYVTIKAETKKAERQLSKLSEKVNEFTQVSTKEVLVKVDYKQLQALQKENGLKINPIIKTKEEVTEKSLALNGFTDADIKAMKNGSISLKTLTEALNELMTAADGNALKAARKELSGLFKGKIDNKDLTAFVDKIQDALSYINSMPQNRQFTLTYNTDGTIDTSVFEDRTIEIVAEVETEDAIREVEKLNGIDVRPLTYEVVVDADEVDSFLSSLPEQKNIKIEAVGSGKETFDEISDSPNERVRITFDVENPDTLKDIDKPLEPKTVVITADNTKAIEKVSEINGVTISDKSFDIIANAKTEDATNAIKVLMAAFPDQQERILEIFGKDDGLDNITEKLKLVKSYLQGDIVKGVQQVERNILSLAGKDEVIRKIDVQFGNGNVDAVARPMIDAAKLVEKGWTDAGEGIATVFSYQQQVMDSMGKAHEVLFTPILPDGTVLTENELKDYIDNTLQGADDILKADTKNIVISVDVSDDGKAGEYLHQLHEQLINLDPSVLEQIQKLYASIGKESTLSEDEKKLLYAQLGVSQSKRDKATTEYNRTEDKNIKKQIEALYEYESKYGSFQERKAAIAAKYDQQIADTSDAVQKASLERQKQEALRAINMEELKSSLDWETVFGDLSHYSTKALEGLKIQLRQALDAKDITAENAKVLTDKILEIEDKISTKTDIWAALIPGLKERNRLINQAAEAQKEYDKALLKEQEMREKMNTAGSNAVSSLKALGVKNEKGLDYEFDELSKLPKENFNELLTKLRSMGEAGNQAADKLVVFRNATTDATQATEASTQAQKKKTDLQNLVDGSSSFGDFMKAASGGGGAVGYAQMALRNGESLKDLVDTIGLHDTEFGEAVGEFSEGCAGFQQAISALQNGDIVGAVNGVIKGIQGWGKSLGTAFGINWSGGNADEVREREAELIASNQQLETSINNLRESFDKYSGVKIIEVSEEAAKKQEEYNKNLLALWENGMGYHDAHHSNAYYWDLDDSTQSGVNEALKKYAEETGNALKQINVDNWDEFMQLTPEEMAYIRDNAQAAWNDIVTEGKYEWVHDYLNQYADQAGKIEEITKQLYENLTQTTKESVFDDYLNDLYDLADGVDDVSESIEKRWAQMKNRMVVKNLLTEGMDEALGDWYKKLAEVQRKATVDKKNDKFDAKAYQKAMNELKEEYDAYLKQSQEEIEELRKTGIITDIDGLDDYKQQALGNSRENISYEQADALVGIETAQQIVLEQIKALLSEWSKRKADGMSIEENNAITTDALYNVIVTAIKDGMIMPQPTADLAQAPAMIQEVLDKAIEGNSSDSTTLEGIESVVSEIGDYSDKTSKLLKDYEKSLLTSFIDAFESESKDADGTALPIIQIEAFKDMLHGLGVGSKSGEVVKGEKDSFLDAYGENLLNVAVDSRNIAADSRDILAGMAIHVEEIRDGVVETIVPTIKEMSTDLNKLRKKMEDM